MGSASVISTEIGGYASIALNHIDEVSDILRERLSDRPWIETLWICQEEIDLCQREVVFACGHEDLQSFADLGIIDFDREFTHGVDKFLEGNSLWLRHISKKASRPGLATDFKATASPSLHFFRK